MHLIAPVQQSASNFSFHETPVGITAKATLVSKGNVRDKYAGKAGQLHQSITHQCSGVSYCLLGLRSSPLQVQTQHLLIALVQAGLALRQRVLHLQQLTLQVPAVEPELLVAGQQSAKSPW